MQGLRRVADVHLVAFDARAAHFERERLHGALLDRGAAADGAARHGVQLTQELRLACRHESRRPLRPHAPDEGIAPRERQERKRPLRREALEGRGGRGRLGMEQADDRVLRITLAFGVLRRALGMHDAARLGYLGRRCNLRAQLREQRRIVRDIAQSRHARIGGVEPRASEAACLRDQDALDRADVQARPDTEPLEDQPARIGERDGAKERWRGTRFEERDLQPGISQGQGERAADRAGATDEHIKHRASALRCPRAASAPRR